MNVLLINGSPHPRGCTYTALSEIAGRLHAAGIETTLVQVGHKAVRGCIACGKCAETGLCVFQDDPVNECIELLRKADGLIVGSPTYYAGPNATLCALLDRVFYMKSAPYAFKPAAAVVTCRRGGASANFDRLNKYFTIARMPVVASQYWNSLHGNTAEEARLDAEGCKSCGRWAIIWPGCSSVSKPAGLRAFRCPPWNRGRPRTSSARACEHCS